MSDQTPENQPPEIRYVLPNAITVNENVRKGTASALERFIFFYQPHNGADSWRRDLQAVVDELARFHPEALRKLHQIDQDIRKGIEELNKEFHELMADVQEIVKNGEKSQSSAPRPEYLSDIEGDEFI